MNYEYYIDRFSHPSTHYKKFVRDYITDRAMIAGRGEEDISVWNELKGEELETAKQFIFKHLEENPKMPYIRASGIIKDNEAVPILKRIIESYPEQFIIEKLYAAKILYGWIGYPDYIKLLEHACLNGDASVRSYLKYSTYVFLDGVDMDEQQKIKKMLE